MIWDYVIIWFGGVAVGVIVGYVYARYGKWTLDELVEAADQVLHSTHLQAHLKDNPALKKYLGGLYDWILKHGGQPVAKPKVAKKVAEKKKDEEE